MAMPKEFHEDGTITDKEPYWVAVNDITEDNLFPVLMIALLHAMISVGPRTLKGARSTRAGDDTKPLQLSVPCADGERRASDGSKARALVGRETASAWAKSYSRVCWARSVGRNCAH